jgi:peptidoglycan hydrolase-like protein with peptidoglycan-binding domain/multidrug efflux pump subunit AcrA (membrane-fusion protein)
MPDMRSETMSDRAEDRPGDATVPIEATGDADPPTAAPRPWWRRASAWIVAGVVLIGAAAVIWVVATDSHSVTTETAAPLTFAEVERTTLEEITTLDGTLGFVAGDPIVYAGSTNGIVTISAGTAGTVTSLPNEGSTVVEGGTLYRLDEQPIIMFYGAVPAYRTLSTRSTDGTDVLQLEEALTRLGYDEDGDLTLDGDFTTATRDAIKALQDDIGVDDTGLLALGSYAFFDGPVFVGERLVDVGAQVNPGMPVIATSTTPSGTVTEVADEGEILDHGDTLFSLEGAPVTLFVTDVPFYRTLTVGTVGPDVQVLEETLLSRGFDAGGALALDETFDEATADAVVAWQSSIGAPVDGVVNIGEIIVAPDPIRIATAHIGIGSTVAPGTALFTPSTSTSIVSVQLPAEDQELLVVGDAVNVVMPDNSDEPGTVTSVGTVAIRNPESGAYFEVEVVLDRDGAGAGLDEAPVEVEIIDDRAVDVLAVPVSALLALSEGGYAVEVDAGDGTTRLVAVGVGMYADGLVEVTSNELEPGDRVVTP